MDQIYVPILSAFVGGLTATIASLGAVWLQGRSQNRRERMKMVIELATKEYYDRREQLMAAGGGPMPPILSFLHYHLELHKILERRELTPEDIVALRQKIMRYLRRCVHCRIALAGPRWLQTAQGRRAEIARANLLGVGFPVLLHNAR